MDTGGVRTENPFCAVQTHDQAGQGLGHLVVQLAGDTLSFRLLGPDHLFQESGADGFLFPQFLVELFQLLRTLANLVFQARLFFQAIGHAVECFGQFPQLVPAFDLRSFAHVPLVEGSHQGREPFDPPHDQGIEDCPQHESADQQHTTKREKRGAVGRRSGADPCPQAIGRLSAHRCSGC